MQMFIDNMFYRTKSIQKIWETKKTKIIKYRKIFTVKKKIKLNFNIWFLFQLNLTENHVRLKLYWALILKDNVRD